jgi:trimeric autotransporter adhesin
MKYSKSSFSLINHSIVNEIVEFFSHIIYLFDSWEDKLKMKTTKPVSVLVIFFLFVLMTFSTNAPCDDSLMVDTGGNIGIGTATPLSGNNVNKVLHIKDNAKAGVVLERGTGADNIKWDVYVNKPVSNQQGGLYFNHGTYTTMVIKNDDSIGVCKTDPSYAIDVNGNIRSTNVLVGSDIRLKKDVEVMVNSLEKITTLRGVSYKWNDTKMGDRQQIGVVAQEVEKIFPEVVFTDKQGYKAVEYGKLIAPVIEAIKELKAENDSLKKRIAALENAK